jgi:hypothetical protein
MYIPIAYIHNGVLFSHKEEWNDVVCRKMGGKEDLMLSEIRQTEKDKYHMFSLIYRMESLKRNDRNVKQVLFGVGIREKGKGERRE